MTCYLRNPKAVGAALLLSVVALVPAIAYELGDCVGVANPEVDYLCFPTKYCTYTGCVATVSDGKECTPDVLGRTAWNYTYVTDRIQVGVCFPSVIGLGLECEECSKVLCSSGEAFRVGDLGVCSWSCGFTGYLWTTGCVE